MLKKTNVSATSQSTMAVGATHKLKKSIINNPPVFASLEYAQAIGLVAGPSGSKTITFSNITYVNEGAYINLARFKVSDDGLTLTLNLTKRVTVTASGNTVENSPSFAFGNVYIIDT